MPKEEKELVALRNDRVGKRHFSACVAESVLPLCYILKGNASVCWLLSPRPCFGIFGIILCLCLEADTEVCLFGTQWHSIVEAAGIEA